MTAYNGEDYKQRQQLRCLLTGMWFPKDKVLAAHIFQHAWRDKRPLVSKVLMLFISLCGKPACSPTNHCAPRL
jgi:hypothetical protein